MTDTTLADLGWSAYFDRQIGNSETATPARVSAVHRDRLEGLSPSGPMSLATKDSTGCYAVGDWVMTDQGRVTRRLERQTTIGRRAAGEGAEGQLIAANVDTLAIVTSCNADFNPARLERYIAVASAGGALPLVVLTKADLADDPAEYRRRAERLSPLVKAIALDATDPEEAARLSPWCSDGRTLALVGSSGVGKTTLLNALTGASDITQEIREDDAKGRHTTTSRALKRTLAGGWLIDTPGMRELRLSDASEGIAAVFADLESLAAQCRFADCHHDSEPGCAIKAAIEEGALDPERLKRWKKLAREDQYNTETLAEARARHRGFQKLMNSGKERSVWKRRIR